MQLVDAGILVLPLITLVFWTRGVWKRSKSDLIMSAVMLVASVGAYVLLSAFSSLSASPWMLLILCAAAATVVILVRGQAVGGPRFAVTCLVVPLCLSAVLFFAEQEWSAGSNALLVIAPYRDAGTWVFDDPRVGLKAEPFVSGIPELIDKLVADAGIQSPDEGFRLLFSARPFPGYQTKIVWRRRENGGNWYYSERYDAEGWLCPALFAYWKRAPREIHVKAEAKSR